MPVDEPVPLVARPVPHAMPRAPMDTDSTKAEAQLFLTDVYQGLTGVPRGEAKYLRIIEDESLRAKEIVEGLLDLSRLDAGIETLEQPPNVDVRKLKQRKETSEGEEAPPVHHALAVVSYNDRKRAFRWQSWRTPGGIYTETEPVVSDGGFQWGMTTPRGKIRYTGKLAGDGQWVESGEFSADGQTWRVLFGMTLTRRQGQR